MEKFPGSNLVNKLRRAGKKAILVGSLAVPGAMGTHDEHVKANPSTEALSSEVGFQAEQKNLPQNRLLDYPTRKLAGNKLGHEYSRYTGIKGAVPETAKINFAAQLSLMWQEKNRISPDNRVVQEVGRILNKDYRSKPAEHKTLEEYMAHIEKVTGEIKNSPGFWEKLGQIKGLSPAEAKLVEDICRSIGSKDLAAYMMTELMPTQDGKLNVEVTDFIIRNAGKEYLESIPALGDGKTSFGPYQMTEFAVYDTPKERRGASIINQALPSNLRIPGSVSHLRKDDHHRAAYLFAADNIANLVKMSSRINKLNVLKSVWRQRHLEIVQIIATAHHGPNAAIGLPPGRGRIRAGMAEKWLANDAKKDFTASVYHDYLIYALKTKANLQALQGREPSGVRQTAGLNPPKSPEPKVQKKLGLLQEISLRGTKSSKAREMELAGKFNLMPLETDEAVRQMIHSGKLVKIPATGNDYYVDEAMGGKYPPDKDFLHSGRPWVKSFVERETSKIHSQLSGVKLKVTALTRSEEYQTFLRTGKYKGKRITQPNPNASPNSAHPTGSVVDISLYTGSGMTKRMLPFGALQAFRLRLHELEKMGLVEATEEKKRESTFHIFVTPDYMKGKP